MRPLVQSVLTQRRSHTSIVLGAPIGRSAAIVDPDGQQHRRYRALLESKMRRLGMVLFTDPPAQGESGVMLGRHEWGARHAVFGVPQVRALEADPSGVVLQVGPHVIELLEVGEPPAASHVTVTLAGGAAPLIAEGSLCVRHGGVVVEAWALEGGRVAYRSGRHVFVGHGLRDGLPDWFSELPGGFTLVGHPQADGVSSITVEAWAAGLVTPRYGPLTMPA